jgi:hypothetical protein
MEVDYGYNDSEQHSSNNRLRNINEYDDDEQGIRVKHDETPITNSGTTTALTASDRMNHEQNPTSRTVKRNPVIGGTETKAVSCLRLVLLAVLVVSATCTAIAVYFYTRNAEIHAFETAYYNDANNILLSVCNALYLTLSAVDSYVVYVVTNAHQTNQKFPFFTGYDSSLYLSQLGSIGRTVLAHHAHFVTDKQRTEWETYTQNNTEWILRSVELQQFDDRYISFPVDSVPNLTNRTIEKTIHNYDGPSKGKGPFLPTWQSYPIIPSK